ncbi:MAG: hypothetical protein ACLFQV_09420, partial [Vulcanimicrobiota bacterium]
NSSLKHFLKHYSLIAYWKIRESETKTGFSDSEKVRALVFVSNKTNLERLKSELKNSDEPEKEGKYPWEQRQKHKFFVEKKNVVKIRFLENHHDFLSNFSYQNIMESGVTI